MPQALTDDIVREIKPSTKRREVSDLYAPGLSLRIGRRAKTWTFTWRFAGAGDVSPITGLPMCGPQQRMTLGTWPVMAVAAAREIALAHATTVAGGKDPRAATSTDNTFGALAREFMAAKDKTVRHNSSLAIRNSLERHVLPSWEKLPIEDIDTQRLNQLVAKVTADVGATTGEVARKWSRAVFTWAVNEGVIRPHELSVRKPRPICDIMNVKTDLYRYYDVNNTLLYVGVSISAISRAGQHAKCAEWFDRFHHMEKISYATRSEALSAEVLAIQEEKPLYNKRHTSNQGIPCVV